MPACVVNTLHVCLNVCLCFCLCLPVCLYFSACLLVYLSSTSSFSLPPLASLSSFSLMWLLVSTWAYQRNNALPPSYCPSPPWLTACLEQPLRSRDPVAQAFWPTNHVAQYKFGTRAAAAYFITKTCSQAGDKTRDRANHWSRRPQPVIIRLRMPWVCSQDAAWEKWQTCRC